MSVKQKLEKMKEEEEKNKQTLRLGEKKRGRRHLGVWATIIQ